MGTIPYSSAEVDMKLFCLLFLVGLLGVSAFRLDYEDEESLEGCSCEVDTVDDKLQCCSLKKIIRRLRQYDLHWVCNASVEELLKVLRYSRWKRYKVYKAQKYICRDYKPTTPPTTTPPTTTLPTTTLPTTTLPTTTLPTTTPPTTTLPTTTPTTLPPETTTPPQPTTTPTPTPTPF